MTSTQDMITKAKTTMMFDHPFFASLIVQLGMHPKEGIGTAKTDGRKIWYDPKFFEGMNHATMVFVLAHEVMHVAMKHMLRIKGRDLKLWNIACDYVINLELKNAGFSVWKNALLDEQYAEMSAEEVYFELQKNPPPNVKKMMGGGQPKGGQSGSGQPGAGQGDDPGGCGGVIAPEQGDAADVEANVDIMVRQAAAIASGKAAGTMPASIKRLIGELTRPKVDWRERLFCFIDSTNNFDYSFMRPNRRFLWQGLCLPGILPDGISHIVVAVDTSVSIDDRVLTLFRAEVQGALDDGRVDRITVVYADAAVQHHEEFMNGDVVRFDAKGGGGTAFADTFRWIGENASDAVAAIYFTDLLVTNFGDEPAMPVMWACHGKKSTFHELAGRVPFGEAIHIDE